MSRRAVHRLTLLAALAAGIAASASRGGAQSTPGFIVRAPRAARPAVAPGAVFTAAFTVVNATSSAGRPRATVSLPDGWTALTSLAPPEVPANGSDLWLVSVATPASAHAGPYMLRVAVESNGVTSRDSVAVTINEHHALDIRALPGVGYVPAGEWYSARFIVRNTGNAESRVRVHATTSHGDRLTLDSTDFRLAPGASTTVTARVKTFLGMRSLDDIVDMIATDPDHGDVSAEATHQTTIIASGANTDATLWSVPGEIWVRAADDHSGVSPVVLWGSGRTTELGATMVDYAIRTRTGPMSLFGEREEYRIGFRSPAGALLLGDQQFGYSQLTSPGVLGTGAELRANFDGLTAGGYLHVDRWSASRPVEAALMFGSDQAGRTGANGMVVQRQVSGATTHLVGGTGRVALGAASDLDVEVGASDSAGRRDFGHRARLSGALSAFTYELGTQRSGTSFASPYRASSDHNVSFSLQATEKVLLTSSTVLHRNAATRQNGGFASRFLTSTLSAGLPNGSGVEYALVARDGNGLPGIVDGKQQAVSTHARFSVGAVDLLAQSQNGLVHPEGPAASTHSFATYGLSVRAALGRSQYLSLFTETADGRSLGAGGYAYASAGVNGQFRLPLRLTLTVNSSATAPRNQLRNWVSDGEVRLEHALRDMTVALRAHISQAGGTMRPGTNGVFLEVRRTLRVPTSRLNLGGRARGRVIDGIGRPVALAMVRLGGQAAVTNAEGEVYFRGLDTGVHRASVEGVATAGTLALGGDSVVVHAGDRGPTPFTLTLSEGARVSVRVRRFETAPGQLRAVFDSVARRDSVVIKTDSLIDVGAVIDLAVALIGSRDTVFLASDGLGRLDFGTVAPGTYTVTVLAGDIPEFQMFQQSRVEVLVKAGEARDVELRMVPKRRAVQIIGGETEVRAVSKPGGPGGR